MNQEDFNIIEEKKILVIKNENAIGKMIDYEELKRLHKEYFPNLNERDFALEVLELTCSSYRHMKNEKKRGRILLRTGNPQISQIQELLINIGYDEKYKINYRELKKLKEIFGNNLDEEFFATKCLKLPLHNGYYALKQNSDYRRHINLPNTKDKTAIDINHTIKKIKDLQIMGQKIKYSEFQKLYIEYGMGMTETEFAQFVLGISLSMYSKIKNDSTKSAKVRNMKLQDTGEDTIENTVEDTVENEQISEVLDKNLCFQIINELQKEHNKGIPKTIAIKNVMEKYNISQAGLLMYMQFYIQIQEEKTAEDSVK